jgi:hypothetical protein
MNKQNQQSNQNNQKSKTNACGGKCKNTNREENCK